MERYVAFPLDIFDCVRLCCLKDLSEWLWVVILSFELFVDELHCLLLLFDEVDPFFFLGGDEVFHEVSYVHVKVGYHFNLVVVHQESGRVEILSHFEFFNKRQDNELLFESVLKLFIKLRYVLVESKFKISCLIIRLFGVSSRFWADHLGLNSFGLEDHSLQFYAVKSRGKFRIGFLQILGENFRKSCKALLRLDALNKTRVDQGLGLLSALLNVL
jgi:hypothetical protein